MPLTSALVVFALLLVTVQSLAQNYDQGPKSLTGGKATLHWSLHNDTRRISLALTVTDPAALNETGPAWIAIGVSEKTSGSMLGADIASAEFGAGVIDNCTLADRYVPWAAYPIEASTKNASSVYPNADASQNDGSWRLVSCSRNTTTGVATLELERPLDAHDDEDRELGPGDQAIIFAYGGSSFRYHEKQRGSTRVVLYNEDGSYPSAKIAPLPKDVSFADEIVATNFSVPTEKTTYACTARKVPLPASGKRVLVAADPIIKSTSGANKLHHLLLYACPETEYAKSFVETGFCLGNGPGENPTSKCRALVFTCTFYEFYYRSCSLQTFH